MAGLPKHRAFVKEQAKSQLKAVGQLFRDFILGEEEPEEFLSRKVTEERMSPGLAQAIQEAITPNEAPVRRNVVDADVNANANERAAKAQIGQGITCAGCRVAMRYVGPKARCSEHS
jgi:hypothetical protein